MPRPVRVEETILQKAMALFYPASLPQAIEALNAVNALVVERVKAEGYVPTNAAQDAPARPKPVPVRRGRPPAAKPPTTAATAAAPAAVAGGTPGTPPPPATPPGDDQGAPPAMADATGDPGSLTMGPIGATPPPDPPVVPAGGRAQTA